jgi:hypothetical protein
MIISRNHLALERVVDDNGVLQFNEDGSALASNKKVVMVLAPVEDEIKERLTILKDDGESERISITPDTAKEILKNVPKDKKFNGLLEHVSIRGNDSMSVNVEMTDGKRSRKMLFKRRERETDEKSVLKHMYSMIDQSNINMCLNRKRLLLMLEAMDKVCEDVSGESPVWISVTEGGDITVRGWDFKYGRPVLGYMKAYSGGESAPPPRVEWESKYNGTFPGKQGIFKKRLFNRKESV